VFIKAITKRNRISHKSYTYHRLLESYRSSRGPRHEILLNLGRLELPKEQWKVLADRIEEIISGQRSLSPVPAAIESLAHHYASLLKQRRVGHLEGAAQRQAPAPILRTVDLRSLRTKGVELPRFRGHVFIEGGERTCHEPSQPIHRICVNASWTWPEPAGA
jgi:hypothetical protein